VSSLHLNLFHLIPAKDADESIESVLIYLCSFLGEKLKLHVSGFGQENWPICSDTDIADVLAQLPNVLKSLKNFSYFEIIFPEQSLSRRLGFYPTGGGSYNIQCFSWRNWIANPTEEITERNYLFNSFYKLFSSFTEGMEEACPQSLDNYWIESWIHQITPETL
jgi:hypothetical protein